ncbi:PPC domain-containing DNA-binding protein [Paraburkholderia dilworthii]|uniref:PPC domain-containing DNA-binding protein n=1 Tax=Paraburkholderia dilworthii TaxID=948106 RepID=UPI00055ABD70|nr:PPC domain-containing DNA-binding protein [Paraburkholderia dilworthii]
MNTAFITKTEVTTVESGHYGRLLVARIMPNDDLVQALQTLCQKNQIRRAVIRSVVGSLIEANLAYGPANAERVITVTGPGVEILSVSGEICEFENGYWRAALSGVVADTRGQVFAGKIMEGRNRSFITIEASIQEWLVDSTTGDST